MTLNNIPNPKTVHEIYRKLLEYGNTCFHCGITYKQIKQNLIKDGFYIEGQAESQLLHLFNYNYYCHTPTCLNPKKNEVDNDCGCNEDDFNCVDNCLHYLSKEGCIDLTKLLDSELNNKTAKENNDTSKTNLKIATITKNLGIVALIISIIGLFPIGIFIIDWLNTSTKKDLQKSQIIKTDSMQHSKTVDSTSNYHKNIEKHRIIYSFQYDNLKNVP